MTSYLYNVKPNLIQSVVFFTDVCHSTLVDIITTLNCSVYIVSAIFPCYILQGSVATCVRCGGICNDHFTANLLLSVRVKEL